MEEKERYEWNSPYDSAVRDNKNNDIINAIERLNKQDKRIKELKEKLDDAKRDYIPKLEFGLQRANKMGRDAEKEIQQLKQQLTITEKALELAVADKCKFENALLSTSLGIAGGKVAVPKKEQYYIEQAKEMLGNEQ